MNNYKRMVTEMFNSVGQSIGIHVMLLVLEHALWKTGQKYAEASLIKFSEAGVSLDGLDGLEPEKAAAIGNAFIMAIIDTLGRLVGIQLAKQIATQFEATTERCDEADE